MNSSGSGWCVPITTIIPASQGYMRLPKGKPTLNSELPCCFGVLINYSLPPFKEVVRPPTPSPPYVQLQQQPTWFCRPLRRQSTSSAATKAPGVALKRKGSLTSLSGAGVLPAPPMPACVPTAENHPWPGFAELPEQQLFQLEQSLPTPENLTNNQGRGHS